MLFIKEIEDAIAKKEINGDILRAYRQSKEYGNSKINFYDFPCDAEIQQLKAFNITEFTISDIASGWIEKLAALQKLGFIVAEMTEVYSNRRIYRNCEVITCSTDNNSSCDVVFSPVIVPSSA